MTSSLQQLISTIIKEKAREEEKPVSEVISVSETVSVAASIYETLRNTLEYDEEHLLRRNAIRRFLKRRLSEEHPDQMAELVLRELIWARYLPNNRIPESALGKVSNILKKYEPMFARLHEDSQAHQYHHGWLLDLLSTEIEYATSPPLVEESLASFAYQELKKRLVWATGLIPEDDRDLQLYIAVHRAILKSNAATLRFRILTLYYPEWSGAKASDPVVGEVAKHLETVIHAIESQISHIGSDSIYRLVRKHTIVFNVLRDIAMDNPQALSEAIDTRDFDRLDKAIAKAAGVRYDRFRVKLRRSVVRAVFFLFMTKTVLALLIELPFERIVLREAQITPLIANILFHPLLLAFIGFTVIIPSQRNTARVIDLIHGLLGIGDDFEVTFKVKQSNSSTLKFVFDVIYGFVFLVTIVTIVSFLSLVLHFNVVSIAFFIFFLTLVTFLGLKIRNTRRDLLVVETGTGFISTLIDMIFLPIVRVGRWIALRAPRVNVFLFFFDFIIEAPFKGTIGLVEGWIAFIREKKEEI